MNALPAKMMKLYFNPTMKPKPSTAEPVLIPNTIFVLSAKALRAGMARVDNVSLHHENVDNTKSYKPPIIPAIIRGLAWSPPFSPETSTWVVAVASGKGNLPCISLTKYLRNGMKNNMPNTPPSSELRNISRKLTAISGYFALRIYKAGNVKIAPATTMPDDAPIDCTITFSPRAFFRFIALDNPTAMIAIGIAASNTCPTFSPR